MFNHRHYVPVLKGRAGELAALKTCSWGQKSRMTPVIEVPPITWDFQNDVPSKTIKKHLEKTPRNLAESWGADYPLFLDTAYLEDDDLVDGLHPLAHLLGQCLERGMKVVPVTGPGRPAHLQATVAVLRRHSLPRVCIRVDLKDVEHPGPILALLLNLAGQLGLSPEACDLLLDLRDVRELPPIVLYVVKEILASVAEHRWLSLTVAGTAFPENLSGISSLSRIPRAEWLLWRRIEADWNLPRVPTFGDYAISSTDQEEIDPRFMKATASIRYTCDQDWLIVKGLNVRDHKFDQFRDLSAQLVRHPDYCGPNFSWGDNYISKCADGSAGVGNLQTWRQVGTSHHLAFVLDRIASLPAP